MREGEKGYVVPWAFSRLRFGISVNKNYTVSPKFGGTATVEVAKIQGELRVLSGLKLDRVSNWRKEFLLPVKLTWYDRVRFLIFCMLQKIQKKR